MKTKDIVVFSIIGLIGVVGIWFVFSKMTAKSETSAQPAADQSGVQSNFSKLNTEVSKKEQVMSDSKTELVKEELRQEEQLREQREREAFNAKNPQLNKSRVSDISSYIEAGKAESNSLTKIKPVEEPVIEQRRSQAQQQSQQQKPVVRSNASSIGNLQKVNSVVVTKSSENESPGPGKKKRKRTKRMDGSVIEGSGAVAKKESPQLKGKEDLSSMINSAMTEKEKASAVPEYSAQAVIYGDHPVADVGKRITVMLMEPLETPWGVVEEGSFVDGICSFGQARLIVTIVSIKVDGVVHKVNGRLVDAFDGMDGLPVTSLSDNQQVGRTVTQSGVTQVASKLGIPLVGTAASALAQKKQQTKEVPLTGDEKVMVVISDASLVRKSF